MSAVVTPGAGKSVSIRVETREARIIVEALRTRAEELDDYLKHSETSKVVRGQLDRLRIESLTLADDIEKGIA